MFSSKRKIFNPNPTRIFKKNYVTISALQIFKTAYNIQMSIGYKDNFCQSFGINQDLDQASFNSFPKKISFQTRNGPDFGFESSRFLFVSGTRCRSLKGRCLN